MTDSSHPSCFKRILKVSALFVLILIPFVFIAFLFQNSAFVSRHIAGNYSKVSKIYKSHLKKNINETKRLSSLSKKEIERYNATAKNLTKIKPKYGSLYNETQEDLVRTSKFVKLLAGNIKFLKKDNTKGSADFKKYQIQTVERNAHDYLRYLIGLTALYWITNIIPIAPVGFLPLLIAPLIRILTVKELVASYMKDISMVILTSSIITLGASAAGLSNRIAIRLLSLCGANRRRTAVVIGLISLLFSMWWLDTAIMIFMCRVIDDIVHEMKEGVSFGTLGDDRKEEWNDLHAYLAEEKARKRPAKKHGKKDEVPKEESHHVELTTHSRKSDEFVNPHAGGSIFVVEKDMKVIHPGKGKEADLVKLSKLPSTTSIRLRVAGDSKSQFSFGTDAAKRLEVIKQEVKSDLEDYRLSLHHYAAVFCSVGGLHWSYTAATNSQLFHRSAFPKYDPKVNVSVSKGILTGTQITLADWSTFTFPIIVMTVPFLLFCLDLAHFGPDYLYTVGRFLKLRKSEKVQINTDVSPKTQTDILGVFQEKYNRLGSVSSHEKSVLILKIFTIIALLFRMSESKFGWFFDNRLNHFVKRYKVISDSTVITIAVVIGFIFPKNIKVFFNGPLTIQEKPLFAPMLGWKPVQEFFPWGILVIIGGSVVLGEAFGTCGLDYAERKNFDHYVFNTLCRNHHNWMQPTFRLFLTMIYTMILANCVGGTCASIVISRFLSDSRGGCYIAFPCVAATAFAFMLPVGTTTVSIAAIKLDGMNSWYCLKRGFFPCLICTGIVYLYGLSFTNAIVHGSHCSTSFPNCTSLFKV